MVGCCVATLRQCCLSEGALGTGKESGELRLRREHPKRMAGSKALRWERTWWVKEGREGQLAWRSEGGLGGEVTEVTGAAGGVVQWVSIRGNVDPREHLAMSETVLVITTLTGELLASSAAKHPAMCATVPHKKELSSPKYQ